MVFYSRHFGVASCRRPDTTTGRYDVPVASRRRVVLSPPFSLSSCNVNFVASCRRGVASWRRVVLFLVNVASCRRVVPSYRALVASRLAVVASRRAVVASRRPPLHVFIHCGLRRRVVPSCRRVVLSCFRVMLSYRRVLPSCRRVVPSRFWW